MIDAAARRHIVDGDEKGRGGHRFGTGRSGKTEFPRDWTDDRIIESVEAALSYPDLTIQSGDRTDHLKEVDGVIVRVSTYFQNGVRHFRTAYPVNGAGVVVNPSEGGAPKAVPFDRNVLDR